MKLYLLDTDTVSLYQHGQPRVNLAVVVTRNVKDFKQVPGLEIEDWSK